MCMQRQWILNTGTNSKEDLLQWSEEWSVCKESLKEDSFILLAKINAEKEYPTSEVCLEINIKEE